MMIHSLYRSIFSARKKFDLKNETSLILDAWRKSALSSDIQHFYAQTYVKINYPLPCTSVAISPDANNGGCSIPRFFI